ncbi:hypothetical protein [Granulicella sibirica]|uniref:Uncharacterized protein n=1 Tax=Granulicella sibirica TaxID=2479048 RepID=A0A4Q0T9G3_9BACT|nr:hypothetical protein [Granulicella sibirica]RXH58261.1 hypothetical protein GRAN_1571 [Granulicella sibirica]
MTLSNVLPLALFCLASVVRAQVPHAASTARKPHADTSWRQQAVYFSDRKPILGVPTPATRLIAHCSEDGTTFLNEIPGPDATTIPDLYRVTSSGEGLPIRRELPLDFINLSVRDFFAADHTLVTLLEGIRRNDHNDPSAVRETGYFLSLSDPDGTSPKLLTLDLKFKPVKVALFGTGDFLVLGWDEINLLPLLALVKEDGTVRRFVDFDEHQHAAPYTTFGSAKEAEAAPNHVTLGSLQRAAFVPYGQQVLLTYPGTARSVRVLSAMGEDRSIPIALPPGFVLHDVLVSGAGYPLVLRAQPREASPGASTTPARRLFEMNSYNGLLLREFVFAHPGVGDVTCASTTTLSAIFFDAIANPATPSDATELVVATAPRR